MPRALDEEKEAASYDDCAEDAVQRNECASERA
jgi:hypothetical protein